MPPHQAITVREKGEEYLFMEDFRQQQQRFHNQQLFSYSDHHHHDNPPLFPQQQHQHDSFSNTAAAESYPPDISAPCGERFLRAGEYFSDAQWQELELQALIYKYMLAGASVPMELILPIKTSLQKLTTTATATTNASSSCFPSYHHQTHRQLQTTMLQEVSYLGRCNNDVDPEPWRCRRTDGKKWRCSREAQLGRKYCERHVHRSRARSRKLVETIPKTAPKTTPSPPTAVDCGDGGDQNHQNQVLKQWSSSMRGGGPLAEALRSSPSSCSTTTLLRTAH
ncbi:hypothetical protein ZOSMA_81G00370 [Zostera marina]|uniref:Growth-regulating factor n=1 Tax=Zostera marina TaxID=29655 RepID=A0A0K9NM06_ZOSMR|nr:hypothetical protein ZOSMA_81G00370 [Zostera marina]